MGGMHGFGAVDPEAEEPVFHEPWEARLFGLAMSYSAPDFVTEDRWRYTAECLPPELYLAASYYERWYCIEALQLVDAGLVSLEELRTGSAATGSPKRDDALQPSEVWPAIRETDGGIRKIEQAPKYSVGDRVRTLILQSDGHIRLPGYAQNRIGIVTAHRGGNIFPESSAAGLGENPEHVYNVEFSARELWGPQAAEGDKVFLDLWESYLEPA